MDKVSSIICLVQFPSMLISTQESIHNCAIHHVYELSTLNVTLNLSVHTNTSNKLYAHVHMSFLYTYFYNISQSICLEISKQQWLKRT